MTYLRMNKIELGTHLIMVCLEHVRNARLLHTFSMRRQT